MLFYFCLFNLQLEIEDPHENHFKVNGASSLNICIIIIIIIVAPREIVKRMKNLNNSC